MSFPLSLNQQEYEALVALARKGAATDDEARLLDAFLVDLETRAGITRHTLWVQWQERGEPLPPGTNFPESWPPKMRHRIDLLTRSIARVDVEEVLAAKTRNPVNVLVTPDPGALVGWTKLDNYFIR